MKIFLLQLVKFYQLVFSPYLGGRCRFTPSCSEYALEAIERHHSLHAVFLILKRLLKCQPWGSHGIDAVPESIKCTCQKWPKLNKSYGKLN